LTSEQLETQLCDKAQFTTVSLHSKGENRFSGIAKDFMGKEYDITVEVSRSRIAYEAKERSPKLTRENLEQYAANLLTLSKVDLDERSPGNFVGTGIATNGDKLQLEVTIRGEGYTVEWKDKDSKPQHVDILSVSGGGTTKSGSLKP
jgi:hypothetical protein